MTGLARRRRVDELECQPRGMTMNTKMASVVVRLTERAPHHHWRTMMNAERLGKSY